MLLLALSIGCPAPGDTGDAEDSSPPTGPGTLALSFRMDDDSVAPMADNGESPIGSFGGSIYAEDDATALGPNDGASSLLDFEVPGVDLTPDGGPTSVLHVTDPIEPQIVWVLGCLDAGADGCGDAGDPITIPNENKVVVVAETETPFEVYMGMLRP